MGSVLKDCSVELVKVAKEGDGYLKSVAVLAPAAVAGSLVDIPKGTVEKAVETRVSGTKIRSKPWKRGVARFGAKVPANIVTLPVFLSGINDLKEGRKAEGMAKVVASGAAYGGLKGTLEGKVEKRISTGDAKKLVRSPKALGRVRGALGALTAIGVASGIAHGQRKKKKTKKDKYLVPAAVGLVGGGVKGGIEEAYSQRLKHGKIKTPRAIKGAIAGRAAAGVIGAAALSQIADWALKKNASDRKQPPGRLPDFQPVPIGANIHNLLASGPAPYKRIDLGPKPGELYYQTLNWAEGQDNERLRAAFTLAHSNDPERTPTNRAQYYAMHDTLAGRGYQVPPTKMRDRVNPPVRGIPGIVEAGAIAAVVLAPTAVWAGVSSRVSTSAKDMVMRDALDSMIAAKGIHVDVISKDSWKAGIQNAVDRHKATGEMDDFLLRKSVTGKMVGRPYPGPMGGKADAEISRRGLDGSLKKTKIEVPWMAVEKNQKPSIIAHEMGHATGGSVQKALQSSAAKTAYNVGRASAIALPLIALASSKDPSFTTPEELEAKAQFSSAVGKIGLVASAPVLAEELIASGKAFKNLAKAEAFTSPELAGKSLGAIKGKAVGRAGKRVLKNLLPAFGTYAAPLALPFIAASYLRRKAEKSRRIQQTRGRR
jgi:hypothetical protein